MDKSIDELEYMETVIKTIISKFHVSKSKVTTRGRGPHVVVLHDLSSNSRSLLRVYAGATAGSDLCSV